MAIYRHSILILASFLLVFLWQNSPFAPYSLPFIGFLMFLFILVFIRTKSNLNLGGPLNFFVLNTLFLFFIYITGGIESNLFFIIHFLLFGAAFIMDPRSVFLFPLASVIVFWPQLFQNDVTANLIKIASMALLSPLAYFFGIQFKNNDKKEDEILKTKERSQASAEEISEDVKEVIDSSKEKLSPNEVEKLNDILEETEGLREERK